MTIKPIDQTSLEKLQRDTFGYFLHETNLNNGLVPDNTRTGSHCSIAAVGLGLTTYPIAVERGFLSRDDAVDRVLTTLCFFWKAPQGTEDDASGYKGFFYHFLDMETGRRSKECEVSTMDSAILVAGALTAATYFQLNNAKENEIRTLADNLYRRMDWQWFLNDANKVLMAWQPECGFQPYSWEGYNESIILYVLALASPTHPIKPECYKAFTSTYEWKEIYGTEQLYAGPLFIHQISHLWIDFREIQDEFMREKQIDYFENTRRATYTQQRYATENPNGFRGYGKNIWGVTASDGPGPAVKIVDGVKREFFDYEARGVPFGPDDGTIAPWSVVASLPFAPEIVLPTLQNFNEAYPEMTSEYGFKCSFNATFIQTRGKKVKHSPGSQSEDRGWISKGYYGIDQGPVVIMIENYLTGFLWDLMKRCPYIRTGLERAGFSGGYLST